MMDETSSVAAAESDGLRERSYNVLNTLHHETRQELELLEKQVCVKDNIIASLKTRLGRYERIYMTVGGEDESVGFGPSSSLVESLLEELRKLKRRKSDVEAKAARQEEEIQRLTVQLRELELELESVRFQPDHEKDQEIRRLRSALEEKERAEATRSVLCASLAEEADQLRAQLATTVKVCQQLLSRLETEKEGGGGGGGQVEEMCQQQKANETSESSVKAQVQQLQEENQQLKQHVAYVQGLNSQWQKYDSSREDYIRGLSQMLKKTTGQGLMPAVGAVGTGLLHQEISRLNASLQEKLRECARLEREVEDVRRQSKERIQTLEQQALIYADDFKSERADRENAQSQIQDLKEQISQLKQQLRKQGASRESRDAVCRLHIEHRMSPRRNKDTSEPRLRTAPERQPVRAAVAACTNWDKDLDQSGIQCPGCSAKFNETNAECIHHLEECGRL